MLQMSPTLSAATVLRTFTKTNTKAPSGFQTVHEEAGRVMAAARELGAPEGALSAAVNAALEAGRDPATDPEVQRIVTLAAIANEGVRRAVESLASAKVTDAANEHAEAIIRAWRKPFDAAVKDLAEARPALGDIELEDAHSVLGRGAAAFDAWTKATKAQTVIDDIMNGWESLANLTKGVPVDPHHRVIRFCEVTAEQWRDHQLRGARLTPWQATRKGLRLRLPTPAEFRADVAGITRAMQAEAEALSEGRPKQATGYYAGA